MANRYEAEHSDGQTYDVTTHRHHDDHGDKEFKDHLLDVIKSTCAGVFSGYIVRFTHKGRA